MSLKELGVFRFSISFYANFCHLSVSKYLSISPRFSYLLVYSCSWFSIIIPFIFCNFGGSCCWVAKSSNSSWPHGLQHARLPCPLSSPGVCHVHVHWVNDAIQPSHPLLPSSPPAFSIFQHQGLFQVSCSHQVAKELELQLQYQSFQRTFEVDFL